MGIDAAAAKEWVEDQTNVIDDQQVEILPDNQPVWALFSAACNQWRHVGMGGVSGLDIVAVNIVAEAMNMTLDEDMLARLRIIECEVVSKMRERR